MVDRVTATPATLELIQQLKQQYGPQLIFHQSGGCCDNSSPNCYLPGELTIGPMTSTSATSAACPSYMTAAQYEYWQHTQLIIDVIAGNGDTFRSKAAPASLHHPLPLVSPTPNGPNASKAPQAGTIATSGG